MNCKMMYNDKAQADLKVWFSEIRKVKQYDLPRAEAIADPVERALEYGCCMERIARIEMNIDWIMGRL